MGASEDVLVKMILRPINPADISLIQGRMGRPSLPLIPGAEGESPPRDCLERIHSPSTRTRHYTQSQMPAGVGTVQACGDAVKGLKPGQRVVCIPSRTWSALDGSGTWQQVVIKQSYAHHV
jgi:NADPH:quinone reductase-like Zn-dependent oxidoreductase